MPTPSHPPRAAALLLLLAACAGPRSEEPAAPEAPPALAPWTTAFREGGVLVAKEIRIEGPGGLLEHFAALQDPERLTYRAEAVPEGFLQTWVVDQPGLGEVRAHLDGWALAALGRLEVLERIEDAPVVLEARGEVFVARGDEPGRELPEFRMVGRRPGEP